MKYAQGEARREPVGSAPIEATCRRLQRRFKQPGPFWSSAGDQTLLGLETSWRNDRCELLFPTSASPLRPSTQRPARCTNRTPTRASRWRGLLPAQRAECNGLDAGASIPLAWPAMSKPAKSSTSATAATSEVPFEEALGRLERVVESMEADELPLEGLLARYEEGVSLLGVCQTKLAAAEVRISQLEQAASGETVLAPLNPPAAAAAD